LGASDEASGKAGIMAPKKLAYKVSCVCKASMALVPTEVRE